MAATFCAAVGPSTGRHVLAIVPCSSIALASGHGRRVVTASAKKGHHTGGNQNGSVQPEDMWDSSLPEYMQQASSDGMCESWEQTLRRGVKGGSPVHGSRAEAIWATIRKEAEADAAQEPLLSSFLYASILSHDNFERSLAFVLSNRLSDATFLSTELFEVFYSILRSNPDISDAALADICAVRERDPACASYSQALLNYKGFHAIQTHRIAHELWRRGRQVMACALQSRMSEVFAVDIHPAAKFGRGILIDHGTGVVIGETAELGNNVSILQNVTLGGTGKVHGDRHPKISDNVLIGASASILGNIRIGKGAQVAAGSLVLKPVPPHTLVAGSPAREVGRVEGNPALDMQHWSVSKKLLESNLANDPFAVTLPPAEPRDATGATSSSSISSAGSGSSSAGAIQGDPEAASASTSTSGSAGHNGAGAAVPAAAAAAAPAAAAAVGPPSRPQPASAAAKEAAQQRAFEKVDSVLSDKEAKKRWPGRKAAPPEYEI